MGNKNVEPRVFNMPEQHVDLRAPESTVRILTGSREERFPFSGEERCEIRGVL